MTNDYRDMCAELAGELEDWIDGYLINDPSDIHTDAAYKMIERARAALAQPEPEGPSDAELTTMWATASYIDQPEGGRAFARAVLARWGANAQ